VLADLDGEQFRVVAAGRVPRIVEPGDDHRGEPAKTAYDALVQLVRTG
jgi:hypothetical protein